MIVLSNNHGIYFDNLCSLKFKKDQRKKTIKAFSLQAAKTGRKIQQELPRL